MWMPPYPTMIHRAIDVELYRIRKGQKRENPPIQVPPVYYARQSIADVGGGPMKIHKLIFNAVANAETESVSAVQGKYALLDGQPNGKLVVRRDLHIDVCHSCARDGNIFVLVDSKGTRW